VYLSDVSSIPPTIRVMIEGCDLLIIDAVEYGDFHPSHFTYSQCIEEVRKLKPKKAFMIGMVI
jgi:phosphoribosyl 1,2-cyclic phosphodiesterase